MLGRLIYFLVNPNLLNFEYQNSEYWKGKKRRKEPMIGMKCMDSLSIASKPYIYIYMYILLELIKRKCTSMSSVH